MAEINENVYIYEDNDDVEVIETVDVIEVFNGETQTIDSAQAFPALGEANEDLKHQLLNGRELADQHPITAITGLRDELNDIEALKVVYSNERNHANYYLWHDENILQENRVGLFVSACSDINEIEICTSDNEIFGVTVESAGFIGAQSDISRDIKYGLVVNTGIVHVKCELSVEVGDCVISNNYGCAKKNDNGYKVVGRHQFDGVEYAEITLVAPIERICQLSDKVDAFSDRMDDAEANIVAAMNVANAAYNKADEAIEIANNANGNATDAINKSNETADKVGDLESDISDINKTATEAKALADSALVTAQSLRDEAIKKSNEALDDTSKLRDEFDDTVQKIQNDLDNTFLELQEAEESLNYTKNDLQNQIDEAVKDFEALEEDLIPLATWPNADNPTGIAGFVAQANEDSATLASMVIWKGDTGDSLAGFVQEATDENATVKSIASYERKDKDGNVIGTGASGLIAQVDDNRASISLIAEFDGNLAGLQAQVDENTASVATLASIGNCVTVGTWDSENAKIDEIYYDNNEKKYYYYEDGEWKTSDTFGSIPSIILTKIYYIEDIKYYWYYDERWQYTNDINEVDPPLFGSLAGIRQTADDNKAQLDAMVAYDKGGKSALAGLTTYVDENSANFSELAKYSNEDSGNSGIAGLVADVNNNTSELSAIVNHQFTKNDGTTVTGLAGLNTYVNENESNVALVSNRVAGKYTVLEEDWNTSGKDLNIVYYVKATTKDTKNLWYYYDNGWKSSEDPYDAGLPSAMAGIQAKTDDNSASIDNLVSWQGNTEDNMARIEQKADDNGASINLMVSSVDKYSVGEYSQSYGLTHEEAKSIIKKDMVYIPTKHSNSDSHLETFADTEEVNEFTPGYYYIWDGNDWIESSSPLVAFYSEELSPSNLLQYWYIDSNEAPEGYEAHALYVNIDGQWTKVNILDGNVNNRITSMIRQTADSVSLEVANARGSYTGLNARLTNTESEVQTVASWMKDPDGNIYNLATIKQTADNAGASVAQIVSGVGEDGQVTAASIVTAINSQTGESAVNINADVINLTVGGRNLLLNSNINVTSSEYRIAMIYFGDVKPIEGEEYTITLKGTLGEGKSCFSAYNSGGMVSFGSLVDQGNGIYSYTGKWKVKYTENGVEKEAANTRLDIYTLTNDVTGVNSSIEWVKFEKGNSSTDWTPAPEDMVGKDNIISSINLTKEAATISADKINLNGYVTISSLGEGGTTEIDGARITTGQVSADRIDASELHINAANISGQNLLLNSSFSKTFNDWNVNKSTNGEINILQGKNNLYCAEIQGKIGESNSINQSILSRLEPNTTYTLSGWTKTQDIQRGSTNVLLQFYMAGYTSEDEWFSFGSKNIDESADWTYVEFSFTTDDRIKSAKSYRLAIYLRDCDGYLYFKDLKLEKGDKATPWVPSNEDGLVEKDKIITSINASEEGVSISGDKINLTGTVSANNNVVIDTDGKITAVNADISGKFNATEGYIGGISLNNSSIYAGKNGTAEKVTTFRGTLASDTTKKQVTVKNYGSTSAWYNHVYRIPTNNGIEEVLRIILEGNADNDEYFLMSEYPTEAKTYDYVWRQTGIKCDMDGAGNKTGWYLIHNTSSATSSPPTYYTLSGSFKLSSDGSLYVTQANVSGSIHVDVNKGNGLYLEDSLYGYTSSIHQVSNNARPHVQWTLYGANFHMWSFKNGTTPVAQFDVDTLRVTGDVMQNTDGSDERIKYDISGFSKPYEILFDNLKPCGYKYINGTSGRVHTGYVAQDVVKAIEDAGLTTNDFAAVVLSEPNTENEMWYLRRDEFVALNTWQIQKAKARITDLETKVTKLEAKIAELTKE